MDDCYVIYIIHLFLWSLEAEVVVLIMLSLCCMVRKSRRRFGSYVVK